MNAIETVRTLLESAPLRGSCRHTLLSVIARNAGPRTSPALVKRLHEMAHAEIRSQLSFLAKTGAR